MTRARKTARAVSLRTDQRPILYVASLVLMVALLLAGCAKVPYPPPELRASNGGDAAWPTTAQATVPPAATAHSAPAPTAAPPAAAPAAAAVQEQGPDLAAALTAARAAQTPVVAPTAPQIAQVRAAAERAQREAAEVRAKEVRAKEVRAKQAATARAQEAMARTKARQQTTPTAKTKQPAPADLPTAERSTQADRAGELARAKAAFERQQTERAAARTTGAEPTAVPAPGATNVTNLAETPAMPAPPTVPTTAPTESVASTPLAEPDLALQIASRGGPDGGAGESAADPMAEPNLMTSLARLSPAAGDSGRSASVGGADLSVVFSEGSGELSVDARNQLFELAQRLQEEPGIDVRLFGYADGLGEGPSRARRLSLSRLMTVRKFLIRQGVDMSTLDGRAMGEDPVAQNATDRVDIVIVRR